MPRFPREFYEKAYDILMELGGARLYWKENFVFSLTEEDSYKFSDSFEYRFQGIFGFGGKFWRRVTGYDPDTKTIYYSHDINYYTEDRTKKLDAIQEQINKRLKELEKEYAKT
jgi:hypothetical protein